MAHFDSTRRHAGQFDETHWSLVRRAGQQDDAGTDALDKLFRCYVRPLYSYARHRGLWPADAEDTVQSFFEDIIRRCAFDYADPGKGRFRDFLRGSLRNFISNEWDKRRAIKRGGAASLIPMEAAEAEACYEAAAGYSPEPEKLFDRVWATEITNRALNELKQEYSTERRAALFTALQPLLASVSDSGSYLSIAKKLGLTETAVRMAMMRMRRRYGELIRVHVARTVSDPAEIKEEIRYLMQCL